MNDEGRPLERPTANVRPPETIAPALVDARRRASRIATLLVLEETQTPLQRSLRALRRTLADARRMDEPSRLTFASVGARTFAIRFGLELLLLEAEEAKRAA